MKRCPVDEGATKKRIVESESEATASNDNEKVSGQAKDWEAQASSLLANHANQPLVALWAVLNDEALYCLDLAMAIINNPKCGLDRSSAIHHEWPRTSYYVERSYKYQYSYEKHSAALKRSKNATPIVMAASACRPDLVEALVAAGADVDDSDALGMTENSDSHSIEALATKFKVGQYSGRYAGCISPLGVAALKGCIDTVKLLHVKGFVVDDWVDETSLCCAVQGGNASVVAYLLTNKADVDCYRHHRCPMYLAVKYGHLDIAKVLLESSPNSIMLPKDGISQWSSFWFPKVLTLIKNVVGLLL